MRVLVACEESQAVCTEYRRLGHEAYSCDIQECSGGHPEWHILGDALKAVKGGQITTMDGQTHDVGKWDMLIAHPPCTYLAVSGNRWFDVVKYGYDAQQRWSDRCEAICFFLAFAYADCDRICIENPIGCMSKLFRKPDHIIQPWMFGDNAKKTTCLWLKGLPKLVPDISEEPELEYFEWVCSKTGRKKRQPLWYYKARNGDHSKNRSKTFPGIARAMAEQWGGKA